MVLNMQSAVCINSTTSTGDRQFIVSASFFFPLQFCSWKVEWLLYKQYNWHSGACSGDWRWREAHSTAQMGGRGQWQHVGGLWLPAVKPVPAVAAAGESLTASVPPPAVYGYTPERHEMEIDRGEKRNQEIWSSTNKEIEQEIEEIISRGGCERGERRWERMKPGRLCSRAVVMCYKGKTWQSSRGWKKKRRGLEYIFPKQLKCVGGEQQSDKEGQGQTQNTHQSGTEVQWEDKEGIINRKQEREDSYSICKHYFLHNS